MKQIAVLGCGTVGSGVVEVFYKNRDSIERKAGCPLDIKWIYLRRPHPELPWQDKLCFDFDQIVSDPQVQIVVEVMGGLDPAYRFVKSCLQCGKSVVTANKELIAQKGAELLQLAREAFLPTSQQEIRSVLAQMAEQGLVRISRGRGGSQLTADGRRLYENGHIHPIK